MKTEEAVTAVLEGSASPLGSHAFLNEFALAYHRAVADRLRAEPSAVLEHARRNLDRWTEGDAFGPGELASLEEWRRILDGAGVNRLIEIMTDTSLTAGDDMPDLREAQLRHARHYARVLEQVEQQYQRGGDSLESGLDRFQAEWSNILAGHGWAAANAPGEEAARLCIAYCDAGTLLLPLRQHLQLRISWLEAALAAARSLKDRAAEARQLGSLGGAYYYLGETRRSIELSEQSLTIYQELGDRRGEGAALGMLGTAYEQFGETRRALDFQQRRLPITRETGDRRGEAQTLNSIGHAYDVLGEPLRAIEFYRQGLAINSKIGDREGEASALGSLGTAHLSLQEPRWAVGYLERALALLRALGQQRMIGNVLGSLGMAYAMMEETGRAVEYLEESRAIFKETGYRRGEGSALSALGGCYYEAAQPERALGYYREAQGIFREIGYLRGQGNMLFNMALAIGDLGDIAGAVALAEQALEIRTTMGDTRTDGVREQLDEWRAKLGDSRGEE